MTDKKWKLTELILTAIISGMFAVNMFVMWLIYIRQDNLAVAYKAMQDVINVEAANRRAEYYQITAGLQDIEEQIPLIIKKEDLQ